MNTGKEPFALRVMHGLMAGMNAFGTAWIGVITVIICADILGRLLFNYPLVGVPEIVKVSVVALVWLQMAHTLRIGGHIRSDVVLARLSPRAKALVNVVAALLGMFVFGFIVIAGWPNMIEGWRIGEFEGELPVRVPTPLFAASTLLYTAAMAQGRAKRDTASVCAILEEWARLDRGRTTAESEGPAEKS